jgi:uncharacterized membrane protein
MSQHFKSLVIGFMMICITSFSGLGVSAATQNQTTLGNMTAGGQGITVLEEETSGLNKTLAGNESAGVAPGYVQVRSSREVNASADQTLEYFMNIQDLPRFHPEYIKNITIIEQQGDNITFEQEASFSGNNISSVNKLTKLSSDNAIIIETIDGSGKGSKFSLIWQETSPGNTRITLDGEFVFQSPPGRPLDDVIQSVAEKRLDEDVYHIEQLSSSAK